MLALLLFAGGIFVNWESVEQPPNANTIAILRQTAMMMLKRCEATVKAALLNAVTNGNLFCRFIALLARKLNL